MKVKNIFAFSLVLGMSLLFMGIAWGETLFNDDFEKENIGEMPSQWELFGGAPGEAKVAEDPLNGNNKVFFVNSPVWVGDLPEGAWAPKDKSFINWTDYTLEGDFMVDDPTKLFAFNYRATDYDNLLHYNVRRWDTGIVGLYKREGGQWSGTVLEVQDPTDANVWYRAQVIAEGDHHICKIKKADDPTDFSKIDPVIEVDVTGTQLTHGTINVMCYGYADNIIVYIGEPTASAIDPSSKSATTWGHIKGQ
jgi:hypothetical protein